MLSIQFWYLPENSFFRCFLLLVCIPFLQITLEESDNEDEDEQEVNKPSSSQNQSTHSGM